METTFPCATDVAVVANSPSIEIRSVSWYRTTLVIVWLLLVGVATLHDAEAVENKTLPYIHLSVSTFSSIGSISALDQAISPQFDNLNDPELSIQAPFSAILLGILNESDRIVQIVPPYPKTYQPKFTEVYITELHRVGDVTAGCKYAKSFLLSLSEGGNTLSVDIALQPFTTWQRLEMEGAGGFCCMYQRVVDEKTQEISYLSIVALIDWTDRQLANSMARICVFRSIGAS